ncbi:hypothetical protein ART_0665 [Arthrobacter sp. PAMC 25486]|nr:hypothetical protein ART_0665 [Arthrobacter sp. PAMC 25486]
MEEAEQEVGAQKTLSTAGTSGHGAAGCTENQHPAYPAKLDSSPIQPL